MRWLAREEELLIKSNTNALSDGLPRIKYTNSTQFSSSTIWGITLKLF